jgi:uncharacterized repeat protein (TIGR01451 family)
MLTAIVMKQLTLLLTSTVGCILLILGSFWIIKNRIPHHVNGPINNETRVAAQTVQAVPDEPNESKAERPEAPEGQPVTITFGLLFQKGPTKVKRIDSSSLEPLPPGYAVYDNLAFDIQSEAIVTGPHLITFNVSSITSSEVFSALRVLNREGDEFDPRKTFWVDRTVLPPKKPRPDFASKTISSRPDSLGPFVVAIYDRLQAEASPIADLEIAVSGPTNSKEPVYKIEHMLGDNLTYSIRVTNNGPAIATETSAVFKMDMDLEFIRVSSSQGACRLSERSMDTVLCDLGTLDPNASAGITVTAHLNSHDQSTAKDQRYRPPDTRKLHFLAVASAKQRDNNRMDNMIWHSPTR